MSVTIPNSPIHGEAMISYPYGVTDSGYTCGWHTGVDLVPHGSTPNLPLIYSPVNGEVVDYSTTGALGYHVTILDNEGFYWRFCHLTAGSVRVSVGDNVTTPTIIGQMGATGNVTGRHLHLECSTTLAWNCDSFVNPCTKLNIPNEDNTIIYYENIFPVTDWIYKDDYLSEIEKENNAKCVINYFRSKSVNDETIAGILANMEAESTIEPILNERGGGGGYGLVQWTPKSVLENHCQTLNISPYTDGNIQCECLFNEIKGTPSSLNEWFSSQAFISNYYNSGATSDMIGITGNDFLSNSMNWKPEKLAILFMSAYERPSLDPSINHYTQRIANAKKWYNFIKGYIPPVIKNKNSKKWFFAKCKKIIVKY